MKIVFRVRYQTVPGQSLWIVLESAAGSVEELPMGWLNSQQWELEHEVELDGHVKYRYQLREEGNGLKLDEWGDGRMIHAPKASSLWVADTWRSAGVQDEVYRTKALQALLPPRGPFESFSDEPKANHRFVIRVAGVPMGRVICLSGDVVAMGGWRLAEAIPMQEVAPDLWVVDMDLPGDDKIEYKYGQWDVEAAEMVEFEQGENRCLEAHELQKDQFTWVQDEAYRHNPADGFRGAGVAIPVFSLRSEKSLGVGEFSDLIAFGDWASGLGMKLVQILPIHDTTAAHDWTDSYPYSAISCFALHPIYLRLDEFAETMSDDWGERLVEGRVSLNLLEALDYEAVMDLKLGLSREVFENHFDAIAKDSGLAKFIAGQGGWLVSYAAFCVLRDHYGTGDFSRWGEHAVYSRESEISMWAAGSAYRHDMLYWIWLQYQLSNQLAEAVDHLHRKGIILKGDLPIGIDRHSVEAWSAPHLFHLDAQSGAPPDFFSAEGQNWGFPTYNWERMEKDGYSWWQSRLSHVARYFDAFRIDHILGFFRIWQIPSSQVDGLRGWFEPAMPVHLNEFREYGVDFDYERYCMPWLTPSGLEACFGGLTDRVISEFLRERDGGGYVFREAFDTQRKVVDHFSGDLSEEQSLIRKGLLACHGDVMFFEAPDTDGTQFHPSFAMQRSRSFMDLDDDTKERVDALYNDYFFKRQDFHWRAAGLHKLDALRRASPMLLCGEDLGMVPECVPPAMREMGILSLEIQRMPKIYGADFGDPREAPYLSVVSPSTHDMQNLREWWQDNPDQARRLAWVQFYEPDPAGDLDLEMTAKIVGQHFESPAMWAIVPIQDLLAMDTATRHPNPKAERINDPSINPHSWRYRMHLNIEDLVAAGALNGRIRSLLEENGRMGSN